MRSESMQQLVNTIIKSTKVNPENDKILLETDQGNFFLSWVGDCCSHCFIANISGSENLVDAKILEVEHSEWKDVSRNDDYEVLESMGTKIKTSKGYVTIETRLSHNGY